MKTPRASRLLPQPLLEFLQMESAGGLVLMAATAMALVIANSPAGTLYQSWLEWPLAVGVGGATIAKPLLLWINDGLMAIFFLLVGMELKRELLEGHLASPRQASLPGFAALGGMLVPALFYAAFNRADPAALRGWAIPAATDIAFALGVLSLLGPRVPVALKALLLSIAIFDDLGAVLVIAIFYTAKVSMLALGVAAGLVLVLALLNRAGVTRPIVYVLIGIPLWVAVLKSGVHATLAGVVVAMFVPMRSPGTSAGAAHASPLRDLEHALHPWVAFGILPVFAFANAGVPLLGLSAADVAHPVPLGIAAGLVAGKPVGVLAFSWLAIRLGVAALPAVIGWRHLLGVAFLCGIGFTMSLFVASLAFGQGDPVFGGLERLGILGGSLVSGVLGFGVLRALPEQVGAGEVPPANAS